MLLKDREFKIICQPKIGTIVLLLLNPNLMKNMLLVKVEIGILITFKIVHNSICKYINLEIK